MDLQNLAYAIIQVAHNFGAVAVLGGAFSALRLVPGQAGMQRALAWLVLAGWATQAASGAAFGTVSWLYYGQFPDIHGIAIAALVIKVACAMTGFAIAAVYLRSASTWSEQVRQTAWRMLAFLAATALSAAAFLRWFS